MRKAVNSAAKVFLFVLTVALIFSPPATADDGVWLDTGEQAIGAWHIHSPGMCSLVELPAPV